MSEQKQYRLLNVGEVTKRGDDYYEQERWVPCCCNGSEIIRSDRPHRRPIEPAGWPEPQWSEQKQPPKNTPILLRIGSQWRDYQTGNGGIGPYWWLAMPPEPPPPPVQPKEAWEAALATYMALKCDCEPLSVEKDAFRAGYLAAQQKGKG